MKVIDGWVKRESFPVKNKSARQEVAGIGCNSLSESECMALQGRPSKSKVETGFLSFMEFFPGNVWVVIPLSRRLRPGSKSRIPKIPV